MIAAQGIEATLAWLSAVIDWRLTGYFDPAAEGEPMPDPPAMPDGLCDAPVGACTQLALALAMARHLDPPRLDPLRLVNSATGQPFTEFGGITQPGSGFTPTVQTAAFLWGGDDLATRCEMIAHCSDAAKIGRAGLATVAPQDRKNPMLEAALDLTPDLVSRLVTGAPHQPRLSPDFPASRLSTAAGWDDLVLSAATMKRLQEIRAWVTHRSDIMQGWALNRQLRPGFACLFHGPPGTGKTLSATLLGQSTGLDVYRVDLSLVTSKWVGETEKNLGRLFDQAEAQDWILFFDEADALFGKRSETRASQDRYANQEVAYLLQRLEQFGGLVILASNLRGNIDKAFSRRFQSVVTFEAPRPAERLALWRNAFAPPVIVSDDLDFDDLAQRHEMTGGAIANVLRHAALAAFDRGDRVVCADDVNEGIRREMQKEGRYA